MKWTIHTLSTLLLPIEACLSWVNLALLETPGEPFRMNRIMH
jgi:hypothetical protein